MTRRALVLISLATLVMLTACVETEGLRKTPDGDGPVITFDLDATPLPEIPLPNNVATILDPSTLTGRRLNISLEASTEAEVTLRKKANTLDGFGIFQPITVGFDAPVDVANIKTRHTDDYDYSNDTILLINVDPDSPGYGELVPFDLGRGAYPLGLEWADQYWDWDPHADCPNLMFETHDEDINGNGVLDPYEDIDFDGVLDKPNTFSGEPIPIVDATNFMDFLDDEEKPIDDLITFYEKETNTLVAWPMTVLRPKTTYAVVITEHMTDEAGNPVRSPFAYVNHLSQNEDLAPLEELLPKAPLGMTVDDVAFAWTFTTQSITEDLEAIRAGMYGAGPFAALAEEYAADMEAKPVRDEDADGNLPDEAYVLYSEELETLIDMVAGPVLLYSAGTVQAMKFDSSHTDYWVLGTFTSPDFLVDKDGIATDMYPAEDDESFEVDPQTGEMVHGPTKVSFMCSIPETTDELQPPFPVIIYGHGYSGAPFEIFGFAGRFAQYGYALCGLDAVGHGMALPSDESIDYDQVITGLLELLGLKAFYNSFKGGRIVDLDNDGKSSSFDNGGDFWSYDLFHTRDMVRQATVDTMQFIKVLRSLGDLTWSTDSNGNGKADDLMGDFNGDGVVDLGTEDNLYYPVWGQSMGAIIAQVAAATEGTVSAAAPVSGAGGLAQVGIRSTNPGVPEAVFMPMMGPFITFTPVEQDRCSVEGGTIEYPEGFEPPAKSLGEVEIAFMINDLHREDRPCQWPRPHYYPLIVTDQIKPGDTVIVRNLDNGEEIKAFMGKDGKGFRVSLPADALNATEKRPLLGLQDGDTQPVPVSCAPGTWTVPTDEEGKPTGPAECDDPAPERSLLFGDHFQIEVLDGWDGPSKVVFDEFGQEVEFQGAIFPEGAPLVALGTGLGRPRNTPGFRQLIGLASMIVARGDPVSYAPYYAKGKRLDFSYDTHAAGQASMIIYHTVGDPNVPVATSLTLARAAGILPFWPDDPSDTTPTLNDKLLGAYVAEGTEGFWRYESSTLTVLDWDLNESKLLKDMRWPTEFSDLLDMDPPPYMPLHFDPDNLDNGVDEFGEPGFDEPVRATVKSVDGALVPFTMPLVGKVEHADGIMALRFPYTFPLGAHGVEPSNPSRYFNMNNLIENQIAVFMASDGTILSDDPCLADSQCDYLPTSIQEAGAKILEQFAKDE